MISPRLAPLLGLVAVLAVPASAPAQDAVAAPQLEIGEPALIIGTPILRATTTFGSMTVERVGPRITVTATFDRRPPGRRASLCVDIAGDRRCVRRKAHRGLTLRTERTADFVTPLRATARSGGALGRVSV